MAKSILGSLNPAELFLSSSSLSGATEPEEPIKEKAPKKKAKAKPEQEAKKAETIKSLGSASELNIPEKKERRLQLLLKPSTYTKLKGIAESKGISVNALINIILEKATEEA